MTRKFISLIAAACGMLSLGNTVQAQTMGPDLMDRIAVHGFIQGGYTFAEKNGVKTNSFDMKRAIVWMDADITPRWSFRFMHDFSSSVQEYFTDVRLTNDNMLNVRFGQFKNAFSIENGLAPFLAETIDLCAEGVTYLAGCGSDPLYGVSAGRDLGLAVFGETDDKFFRYEINVLNGTGINRKDRNNSKDVIGRLEFRPVNGLNIVATGQIGYGNALVGPTVFNPLMVIGQDYRRNRYSIGANYRTDGLGIHSEFVSGYDRDVESLGAYITGFKTLCKTKNGNALDLVASYDYFDFNTSLDLDMHKAVLGLQYWFFKGCRLQMQYVYKSAITDYRSVFNKIGNHALMCQVQVKFN